MQAEHIENLRIVKAIQKLNIPCDAPLLVEELNIFCTLGIRQTTPQSYQCAKISRKEVPYDLLAVDNGKGRIYWLADERNGILRPIKSIKAAKELFERVFA